MQKYLVISGEHRDVIIADTPQTAGEQFVTAHPYGLGALMQIIGPDKEPVYIATQQLA